MRDFWRFIGKVRKWVLGVIIDPQLGYISGPSFLLSMPDIDEDAEKWSLDKSG